MKKPAKKTGEVILKTITHFSETSSDYKLLGIDFEYDPRKTKTDWVYLKPVNNRGTHIFRWWAIDRADLPKLIKELSKFV